MKTIEHCCKEKLEKESYNSLIWMLKYNGDDEIEEEILNGDGQMLELLLKLQETWKEEIQVLFLTEMLKLIKILKNIKLFFEAPNHNEFLYSIINNTGKKILESSL